MAANSGAGSKRPRVAAFAVALAGLCLLAGCQFPTTVYGRLALKPGQDGDVRLARVELHDSVAWDSAAVYTIVPESGGQFSRASFEFPAVAPGPYYLLAWQDRIAAKQITVGVNGIFPPMEFMKPGSEELTRKISYAVAIPGWNMFVGTGAYLEDIDAKLKPIIWSIGSCMKFFKREGRG